MPINAHNFYWFEITLLSTFLLLIAYFEFVDWLTLDDVNGDWPFLVRYWFAAVIYDTGSSSVWLFSWCLCSMFIYLFNDLSFLDSAQSPFYYSFSIRL